MDQYKWARSPNWPLLQPRRRSVQRLVMTTDQIGHPTWQGTSSPLAIGIVSLLGPAERNEGAAFLALCGGHRAFLRSALRLRMLSKSQHVSSVQNAQGRLFFSF